MTVAEGIIDDTCLDCCCIEYAFHSYFNIYDKMFNTVLGSRLTAFVHSRVASRSVQKKIFHDFQSINH